LQRHRTTFEARSAAVGIEFLAQRLMNADYGVPGNALRRPACNPRPILCSALSDHGAERLRKLIAATDLWRSGTFNVERAAASSRGQPPQDAALAAVGLSACRTLTHRRDIRGDGMQASQRDAAFEYPQETTI